MVDTSKDLQEAIDILEGRTLKQPTIAHLRSLHIHHEDQMIRAAMKVAEAHDAIMAME